MKLSPIQEKIVETPGNLIVRASAGTGKTHTMVNKIAKEIDDNHTHKVIAAILLQRQIGQQKYCLILFPIKSQHYCGFLMITHE